VSSALIVWKSSGGKSCFSDLTVALTTLRLYNNIVPPSQLPAKANYYLFKVSSASVLRRRPLQRITQEGIIPAWEDDANKNGGKWSIQLPKDKNRPNVDKMWLYTV
jgi:translation initiation factor 4E